MPSGDYKMRELVVTPNGSYATVSSDDMLFNLLQAVDARKAKDLRDSYRIQRNMNQAQEGVAHNFGMPLMFAATSPLGVLGWTAASLAAHEAAKGHPTAEKVVNAAELGLLALGAGVAGSRVLLNNTNWGKAYLLSRAIGRGKVRETPTFGNNELFRTTVYRGGPIKYPRQLWVTTDPKYAAQYGPVRKYLFETRNPSYAELPLMGARDPVSMDMMIDMHTRNNPQALAIIGHDLVTGEFPYESQGLEILSLNPYQFRGFRPKLRLVYPWQQPSRSTLTAAEKAGVPKGERNFKSKWHVANYPGYQLKGLMKGSPLERQLSKNGTININLLNAYFNKASQIEREVANKVLAEKFAGLKTINYNLFKKAVLDELIGKYNRVPLTEWADYGMDRLGLVWDRRLRYELLIKDKPAILQHWEYNPNTLLFTVKTGPNKGLVADPELFYGDYFKSILPRLNTFTFESSSIPIGNNKHYDITTLGHSRTYTTPDEPNILHVMESLSDWALSKDIKKLLRSDAHSRLLHKLEKELAALDMWNKSVNTGIAPDGHVLLPYEIQQIRNDFIWPLLNVTIKDTKGLLKELSNIEQIKYLNDNYIQRQLQENLRYAAENGLTKMRYPTSETAAKIEGYLKKTIYPTELEMDLYLDSHPQYNLDKERYFSLLLNPKQIKTPYDYGEMEELKSRMDKTFLLGYESLTKKYYTPEHQTILKKYADFPKLFLKLYKDLKVRTVTDAKGNTWYEVDVPKGYLSREWLFKFGGKFIPPIIAGNKKSRTSE